MSARQTIMFGAIGIVIMGGILVWVQQPEHESIANASVGRIAGLSVRSVDGADHLVETHIGPAGYFSLADQLAAIGVTLSPEDRYAAIPDPTLGVGSVIEITRATPVTIRDANDVSQYFTWETTVDGLLSSLGITVDEDDVVVPPLDHSIARDEIITITRVGTSEEIETEDIPFKTLTKLDNNLDKGSRRVSQAGRVGIKTLTYEVTHENGEEVARQLIDTEITREPVDKIIYQGTRVVSYGTGEATWYALRSGMQAAHNTLPFGTWVKVTALASGKSVDVQITDRGIQGSAIIDLTADAFAKIAPLGAGRINVKLVKDWD